MKYRVTVKGEDQGFSCSEEQNLLQGMRTFQFGVPMLEAIPVGCRLTSRSFPAGRLSPTDSGPRRRCLLDAASQPIYS